MFNSAIGRVENQAVQHCWLIHVQHHLVPMRAVQHRCRGRTGCRLCGGPGCRLCSTAGVCRSREFWQEAVGTSRLTGHQDAQDAQDRESEESPKTAPGNNGTGRHDAGRNSCTTASAAPLSTSPAASGWRRSTRRRSTPSVGRSRRMGARRGAPLPRGPTPAPRMVCHPAEPPPGRAARRRHWPRCRHYWPCGSQPLGPPGKRSA